MLPDVICPIDAHAAPDRSHSRRAARRSPSTRSTGLFVTRAADYAIRALVHLARQPRGTRLDHAALAAAIDAPAPFVAKVVHVLSCAALVESRRGKGGGVSLGEAALAASMYDVIRIVDGPPVLNSCLSPESPCARHTTCPAHRVWAHLQGRVVAGLREATIARLAQETR